MIDVVSCMFCKTYFDPEKVKKVGWYENQLRKKLLVFICPKCKREIRCAILKRELK